MILENGTERSLSGNNPATTNNIMELTAVIKALEPIEGSCNITLISDSKYVLDGLRTWIPGWKKKNWRLASGKPVKNRNLWQKLDQLTSSHTMTYQWVKGHSGNFGNDFVDEIANIEMDKLAGVI